MTCLSKVTESASHAHAHARLSCLLPPWTFLLAARAEVEEEEQWQRRASCRCVPATTPFSSRIEARVG